MAKKEEENKKEAPFKTYQQSYKQEVDSGKVPVRINDNTIVFVKPGTDIEAIKKKYESRFETPKVSRSSKPAAKEKVKAVSEDEEEIEKIDVDIEEDDVDEIKPEEHENDEDVVDDNEEEI
jgi:hypothetical protein